MSIIPYLVSPNTEQDIDVLWEDIVDAPNEFPALPHEHAMSDIPGLQSEINSKANSEHSHTSEEVSGLSSVATTGDYSDLSNKPNIPSQASDVGAASAIHSHTASEVEGLASVAISGDYDDLVNKPVIPVVSYPVTSVNSKTGSVTLSHTDVGASPTVHTHSTSQVTGLSTVATSGSYNDLSNRPTIPTVNYPVISVNGKTGSVVITTTDIGAAAVSHVHSISEVINLQTTLNGKFNTPTGTTSQYVRGDGTLATFPSIPTVRRVETYLGSTDSSGNYSVVYSTPFSSVPDVQPQLQAGTASQVVRITSSTVSGFTVNVTNRASVNVVGVEVLLAATTPVNGASVSVLVTAR